MLAKLTLNWQNGMVMKVLLFILLLLPTAAFADETGRFFREGDGKISFSSAQNERKETITYRAADGSYPARSREQIDALFGLTKTEPLENISLRFIALLDYIQDRFGGGEKSIQLNSAYRSPHYNQSLRNQGRTVAKASTHIEGMAADIQIAGVDGKFLWESLQRENCCGVGWYGGMSVHVDTGPARFWTGKTSKVRTDISENNKLILLRTDRDIYYQGETMRLSLRRITQYPFGVLPEASLVSVKGTKEERLIERFQLSFGDGEGKITKECMLVDDSEMARRLFWRISNNVKTLNEPLAVHIEFCNKPAEEMPNSTLSNRIEIR